MKNPYINGNKNLKAAYDKLTKAGTSIPMGNLAEMIGVPYPNLRSNIISSKVGAIEIIDVGSIKHASIVEKAPTGVAALVSDDARASMIENMTKPMTIKEIAKESGVSEAEATAFAKEQNKLGNIDTTAARRQCDYRYEWIGMLPKPEVSEPEVAEQESTTLEAALDSFAEEMEAYARADAESESEPAVSPDSEMQPVVLVLVNSDMSWFSDEAKAIEFAHENASDGNEVMVIYTSKAHKVAIQPVIVTTDLIESARKCA